MQISIVIMLFLDQISGRGKSFQGGGTASGGHPLPSPVEESQKLCTWHKVAAKIVGVRLDLCQTSCRSTRLFEPERKSSDLSRTLWTHSIMKLQNWNGLKW